MGAWMDGWMAGWMDGYCAPIKFEFVFTHRANSTVVGIPFAQFLFLDMTHFSSRAKPKKTSLKTDRGLMVQELRRKEYMTSRK